MNRENSGTDNSDTSRKDSFSHAYIVWGGSETDMSSFAERMAAAIVCTGIGQRPCMTCAHCEKASKHIHPDIIAVDKKPDAREIYVDQIRALREDAIIMPNEASKKVYIIYNASSMNKSAQNAILKLLEDPPESAAFILIAGNPAALLPTLRSRCVERMAERRGAEPARMRQDSEAFSEALKAGPLKLAELSFSLGKLEKSEFAEFIIGARALLISNMRSRIDDCGTALTTEYMMKAINVLDRAEEYLNNNVSPGHIAGMICAALI